MGQLFLQLIGLAGFGWNTFKFTSMLIYLIFSPPGPMTRSVEIEVNIYVYKQKHMPFSTLLVGGFNPFETY